MKIEQAKEIIEKILYITIASVNSDGQPWNTPLYSAFDKDLNFYWFSDRNSQHSRNIRNNEKVFLVIYDSTVPEGTGEGVYIQALAHELNDEDEAINALRVMDERVGRTRDRNFEKFSGDAPLRVYCAMPKKIWANLDDKDSKGNYIKDIRVEVPILQLKELFNES